MVLIKHEVGETHRGAALAGDVGPPVGGAQTTCSPCSLLCLPAK